MLRNVICFNVAVMLMMVYVGVVKWSVIWRGGIVVVVEDFITAVFIAEVASWR